MRALRGRLGLDYEVAQGIEEVFELWAATSFLMVTWHDLRAPLSVRVKALGIARAGGGGEGLTEKQPEHARA